MIGIILSLMPQSMERSKISERWPEQSRTLDALACGTVMNTQFLAQLRLANFPQHDEDAVPTCAELVTACGRELDKVEWERTTCEWTAYSATGSPYSGQTPEDALANLWLATHRQFMHESTQLSDA